MADTHTTSQETEANGHAIAAGTDSQVEFIGPDELKARLAASAADNADGEATTHPDPEEVVIPKKPPKVKQPKPTGFEDYHADGPITPNQHAEERELYDKFVDHRVSPGHITFANICRSSDQFLSQRRCFQCPVGLYQNFSESIR